MKEVDGELCREGELAVRSLPTASIDSPRSRHNGQSHSILDNPIPHLSSTQLGWIGSATTSTRVLGQHNRTHVRAHADPTVSHPSSMSSHSPPSGGLGDSPIVRSLPKSPDGEGLTRAQLAALNAPSTTHSGSSLLSRLPRSTSQIASASTYTTSLVGTGFHPTLVTTFSSPPVSPLESGSCALTLLYHLPAEIILDPYQLAQLHADGALVSPSSLPRPNGTRYEVWGETELELPVSRVGKEGMGLRVEIEDGEALERVEVPVHGRYLEALSREEEVERGLGWWWEGGAKRTVEVEWPWVGWVCQIGKGEHREFGPLFTLSLPYWPCSDSQSPVLTRPCDAPVVLPPADDLSAYTLPPPFPPLLSSILPPAASLHPLPPSSPDSVARLILPVGRASHLPLVELGTTLAVWLTAGWVAYKGWRSFRGMDERRRERAGKKVE